MANVAAIHPNCILYDRNKKCEYQAKKRDYTRVHVNLQTDVREDYLIWRYYYGKKKRKPTESDHVGKDVGIFERKRYLHQR